MSFFSIGFINSYLKLNVMIFYNIIKIDKFKILQQMHENKVWLNNEFWINHSPILYILYTHTFGTIHKDTLKYIRENKKHTLTPFTIYQ